MASFTIFGLYVFAVSFPSFEPWTALTVGCVVAVTCLVIIGVAIALPGIAIVGGASLLGTGCAVGGISLAVGIIGGVTAGLYKGHVDDIIIGINNQEVKKICNQLHIKFEPKKDQPEQAKPFECTIVTYMEENVAPKKLKFNVNNKHLEGKDADDFYPFIKHEISGWLAEKLSGDADKIKRRVIVYMAPFPGDSVFSRIADIVKEVGAERIEIESVLGPWKNATEDKPKIPKL